MNFLPIAAALALSAAPLSAQTVVPGVAPATTQPEAAVPGVAPASDPSERRLTPDQVTQVLAEAAKRNRDRPAPTVPGGPPAVVAAGPACPTTPHGEMGVEAGTGGYGAVYGATTIPLGCHGAVSIAVESATFDGRARRRR